MLARMKSPAQTLARRYWLGAGALLVIGVGFGLTSGAKLLFVYVLLAGVLLGLVALVLLGAFPPQPQPQPVQRVLPNDRFQPR